MEAGASAPFLMYPRMLFPNGEWDGVSQVDTVTVASKEEEAEQAEKGFLPIWPAEGDRPAGKAPEKKIVPAAPPPGYDDKFKQAIDASTERFNKLAELTGTAVKVDRRRKEYRDANRNDADQ